VSNVEIAIPMALIYKVLFPSISTFETLPRRTTPRPMRGCCRRGFGFDHGVGHLLLLLDDAKAPHSQKSKNFKGLWYYPANVFIGTFYIILENIKLTTL